MGFPARALPGIWPPAAFPITAIRRFPPVRRFRAMTAILQGVLTYRAWLLPQYSLGDYIPCAPTRRAVGPVKSSAQPLEAPERRTHSVPLSIYSPLAPVPVQNWK